MPESIEFLIKVANDNLKSEFEDLPKEIEKTYESRNIKNEKEIDNLIDKNDDLKYSLKKMKRLKLLIKKLKKIKSMKEELSMYAYKPERMTTDDEEEWINEENESSMKKWIPDLVIND